MIRISEALARIRFSEVVRPYNPFLSISLANLGWVCMCWSVAHIRSSHKHTLTLIYLMASNKWAVPTDQILLKSAILLAYFLKTWIAISDRLRDVMLLRQYDYLKWRCNSLLLIMLQAQLTWISSQLECLQVSEPDVPI
jgi:hypothetical protein